MSSASCDRASATVAEDATGAGDGPHPLSSSCAAAMPEPLVAEVAGSAGQLRVLRHRLRDWARAVGFDEDTVGTIELAVYEALTNAAEHAYPSDSTAPVALVAVAGGAVAEVKVSDHGRWQPPAADPGSRGRGLQLIEQLAGRAEFDATAAGTIVTMSWLLPSRRDAAMSGHRQ